MTTLDCNNLHSYVYRIVGSFCGCKISRKCYRINFRGFTFTLAGCHHRPPFTCHASLLFHTWEHWPSCQCPSVMAYLWQKKQPSYPFSLVAWKERTKLFFSIALSSYLNEEGWLSVMQQSQPKTRGLFQGLALTLERPSLSSKVHWFEFSQLTGMPVKMKNLKISNRTVTTGWHAMSTVDSL